MQQEKLKLQLREEEMAIEEAMMINQSINQSINMYFKLYNNTIFNKGEMFNTYVQFGFNPEDHLICFSGETYMCLQ